MQGIISSPNFDFAGALADSNGRLREYKLVLPHDCHIKREHIARYLRCIFDHFVRFRDAAVSGIEITLVLLDPHFRTLDTLCTTRNQAMKEQYLLRGECVKVALQRGLEVVMAHSVDRATGEYVCSKPICSVDEFVGKINGEVSRVPHGRMWVRDEDE